jgi:hypothetical protein
MPESPAQTYATHRRMDPSYHYFIFGVIGISLLMALWNLIKNPGLISAWMIVVVAAAAILALKARVYPLKVQDRLIRLEERQRLSLILGEPLRSRIGELNEYQLVALRFASDAELPALVEKTLNEKLSGEQVKKHIVSWRPDTFRV